MKLADIRNGAKIQFSLYGEVDNRSSVIGTVDGTLRGYRLSNGNEMRAYHQAIYQVLPEELKAVTPVDYRECEYIIVVTASGEDVTVALPWIVESTLQEVSLRGFKLEGTNWDRTKLSENDIRVFFAQFGINITSILEE